MSPLPWPENHHLDAAAGWLMLGNLVEARAELNRISPANRQVGVVLELEWQLLAAERNWESAARLAESHIAVEQDSPQPWIHRSFALHELRRTQEALDKLLPAAGRFSEDATIPYNLACYACQLRDLVSSRRWLARSLAIDDGEGSRKERLEMALHDPDLEPLWPEIRAGKFG